MTTFTKYEPALTYDPSFKIIKGIPDQKLYLTVNKSTKSQYIRICIKTPPEEVLFTIRLFKNTAKYFGIETSSESSKEEEYTKEKVK